MLSEAASVSLHLAGLFRVILWQFASSVQLSGLCCIASIKSVFSYKHDNAEFDPECSTVTGEPFNTSAVPKLWPLCAQLHPIKSKEESVMLVGIFRYCKIRMHIDKPRYEIVGFYLVKMHYQNKSSACFIYLKSWLWLRLYAVKKQWQSDESVGQWTISSILGCGETAVEYWSTNTSQSSHECHFNEYLWDTTIAAVRHYYHELIKL